MPKSAAFSKQELQELRIPIKNRSEEEKVEKVDPGPP